MPPGERERLLEEWERTRRARPGAGEEAGDERGPEAESDGSGADAD